MNPLGRLIFWLESHLTQLKIIEFPMGRINDFSEKVRAKLSEWPYLAVAVADLLFGIVLEAGLLEFLPPDPELPRLFWDEDWPLASRYLAISLTRFWPESLHLAQV